MASAQDGKNPGRTGQPARQSGGRTRSGRGEAGIDPTNELGATPSEIFGIAQSYSSGANGTSGAKASGSTDVTNQAGQLDDALGGTSLHDITNTGMPGSQGGHPAHGGESITYTDPWAVIGGVTRDVTVQGQIGGAEDWTKAIDGYSPGPTLPGLENARPTDTGVGSGHVREIHP